MTASAQPNHLALEARKDRLEEGVLDSFAMIWSVFALMFCTDSEIVATVATSSL